VGDSKTVTLSFANSTNSAVTMLTISVSGLGFSASGVSAGTILNPGQTANLNVTFAPASILGNHPNAVGFHRFD
jgi:hypothetical protein